MAFNLIHSYEAYKNTPHSTKYNKERPFSTHPANQDRYNRSNSMNRFLNFFLAVSITAFSLVSNISLASINGIPGYSLTDTGSNSCHACHTFSSSAPSNTLTISGSSSVLAGATSSYTIKLVAPDFQTINYGGFDISANDGLLQSVDSETTVINSELVHNDRKATTDTGSSNDVQWRFNWQAPTTPGTSTLSACGLPVNGDGDAISHDNEPPRDGKAACTTFNIQVQQAPSAVAGNNQTVTEGNAVILDGTGSSDADGSISNYAWVQLSGSSAALSNANTDTASFNAPAVAANTTDELIFELTVTDNDGLTDTSNISVFVQDVLVSNTPPVANAGVDQNVNETTAVTLDASASTDDGSIASYSWLQIAGSNTISLNNASTAMADFTAPSVTSNGDLLTFELTVTDNLGVSSTDTINITINDVDIPPVAKITNDSGTVINTIGNNIAVTLYGNFSSDADGPISAYSWVQTAGSAIVSPDAGNASSFSFTTPDDADNTIDIQLTVTGDEGSVQDIISISLTLINQPPVADAGLDQLLTEGASVSLDGSFSSDTDGTIVSYSWAQLSGTTAALNNATLSIADFIAPDVPANTTDELVFQLTVTDNYGLTNTRTVSVFVQDVLITNQLPVANAGTDQIVNENTLVSLDASASTDDGSIISYFWQQIAGTSTITLNDSSSITPNFTAPEVTSNNDDIDFSLTVTDDLGTQSSDIIHITVNDVDTPPVARISDISGTVITSINNNLPVTLYGTFSTDAEGPISAYSWSQSAGSPIVNPGAANTSSFSFTAPDDAGNTLDIQLTVTGDQGLVQDTITTTLTLLNQPPVANAGSAQLVVEGDAVTLDGSFSSDIDGTITRYLWQQIAGTTATLSNANTSTASFSAPNVTVNTTDNLTFRLTVTDAYGLTDSADVVISVEDVLISNIQPVASAGADQSINENTLVTLDGSASSDDGTVSAYSWTQTAGTSITLSNANTVSPSFNAPEVNAAGDILSFELIVTDNLGVLSIADSVNIIVNDVDTPPIARITDISGNAINAINSNALVTLYGTFSTDAEGSITAYSWSQSAGSAIINPGAANTSSFSFTAPNDAGNSIDIQLTVTGDQGLVQNTVTATLTLVNQAAIVDAGPDQSIIEGEMINLIGSASDANNNLTRVKWRQINCSPSCIMPAVDITLPLINNIASASVLSPSVNGAAQQLDFELSATDSNGLSTTSVTRVTVNDNAITGFPLDTTTFYSFNGQPMAIAVKSLTPGSTLFISNLQPQDNSSVADNIDRPLSFPYELNNLELTLSAPASVEVTLYFPQTITDEYDFYEYLNSNGWTNTSKAKNFNDLNFSNTTGWAEISEEVEFSADRRSVKILLSDGGASDSDPRALIISSQAGIGQTPSTSNAQPGAGGGMSTLFLLISTFVLWLLRRLSRRCTRN